MLESLQVYVGIQPPWKDNFVYPPSESGLYPVLFDLKADATAISGQLKVVLELVFQGVPIKRPLLKGNWYVGSTNVEIEFRAFGGMIKSWSKGKALTVEYELDDEVKTTTGAGFDPSLKTESGGGAKLEAKAGSVTASSEHREGKKAKFSGQEYPIAAKRVDSERVSWQIAMPRGKKVVRDFQYGNADLLVFCTWHGKQEGYVRLLPPHTIWTDGDYKQLSGIKSLLMSFILAQRNPGIKDDEVSTQFTYTPDA